MRRRKRFRLRLREKERKEVEEKKKVKIKVEVEEKNKKTLRMIRKIQKVPQSFLNLNLAILQMRIAENFP